MNKQQEAKLSSGKRVAVTPVFDTYWRFAAERQSVFMKRVHGARPPWTDDPVISNHRFTNAYRASDRVSQYLIRHVIYEGSQTLNEVFFRTLLFKFFNKIETWETLSSALGELRWDRFDFDRYARVLDAAIERGEKIYSAAYIMPSPSFGFAKKHRNHLRLLEHMLKSKAQNAIARSKSLQQVYETLLDYPSLGHFLAFQFAIDLNYSEIIDFSEMDFVVAGPGALNGIRKCFGDNSDLSSELVIKEMCLRAPDEFKRLGLNFQSLWGRPLQLIDCQNLFCEVDKYARVVHPDVAGETNRTKIKQKYSRSLGPVPQWYPQKWGLRLPPALTKESAKSPARKAQREQLQLNFS